MYLTREQVRGRKEKAARFTRQVLDDPERAAEIEAESLESYARRRRIDLVNPQEGGRTMATTRKELQEELDELQQCIEKAHESLSDAYTPEATRGELARAVGETIDLLEPHIEEEPEDEDESGESEDEE